MMADLNPPMFEKYGLMPAISWHSDRFSERTGIKVGINGTEYTARLPQRMEVTLFRIVQEALNNVAKHAQANQVTITYQNSPQVLRLCIKDDGVGFAPCEGNSASDQPHWGLLTMKERAAAVGGSLVVQSAPGRGTCVVVEIRRNCDDD
jgi:two-component system, NarL family, sensor histidine kinase UhpB